MISHPSHRRAMELVEIRLRRVRRVVQMIGAPSRRAEWLELAEDRVPDFPADR